MVRRADCPHAEQVFHVYQPATTQAHADWRFCPRCGGELEQSDAGEAPRGCRRAGCDFRLYSNPLPAVSVLVADGDRFLACRRQAAQPIGGGRWCLPCGYVEHGEDYLSAARREVREETGIEVELEAILSVVTNFHAPHLHSLVAVLLARPVGGSLSAGDDASDARWFESDAAAIDWAFEADRHIVRRHFAGGWRGAPVDPRYAGAHGSRRSGRTG